MADATALRPIRLGNWFESDYASYLETSLANVTNGRHCLIGGSWPLAGVLIDEIGCTFPTLKGLFERPVRSDQFGDRYSRYVTIRASQLSPKPTFKFA